MTSAMAGPDQRVHGL